jgi:hypothetical protein
MSASVKQGESGGVACRDDGMKRRQGRANEVTQEIRIF